VLAEKEEHEHDDDQQKSKLSVRESRHRLLPVRTSDEVVAHEKSGGP
jgi:hypothetical protein